MVFQLMLVSLYMKSWLKLINWYPITNNLQSYLCLHFRLSCLVLVTFHLVKFAATSYLWCSPHPSTLAPTHLWLSALRGTTQYWCFLAVNGIWFLFPVKLRWVLPGIVIQKPTLNTGCSNLGKSHYFVNVDMYIF